MKRVGIYTIQTENYGNRLQNYATQYILEKMGLRPYTILMRDTKISGIKYMLKKIMEYITFRLNKDSRIQFFYFNRNINYSRDYIGLNNFSHDFRKYFAIVVGSDQIWNTTFNWLSENVFLPFPHPRKIAFSASFGIESVSYNQRIVDCLNDFKTISVREDAGAKIVRNLTGRDAVVLVDPTMLLTREEWRMVSKKPKGAKDGGYILTYFLSPKSEEVKERLAEIGDGREVYELLNPEDKVSGSVGPSEFLWLCDHADIILTDSFHACVFSFLFDKPFIVYDRNWNEGNMNSRLETLLSKFSLERKYTNFGLENDIWEHDYVKGYRQLEIERKKAYNFLKEALKD